MPTNAKKQNPPPKSSTPPKESTMKTPWFLVILAILIGVVVGLSFNGCNKSKTAVIIPPPAAQADTVANTDDVVDNQVAGSYNWIQTASATKDGKVNNHVGGSGNTLQTVVIPPPPAQQHVTVQYLPAPQPQQVLPPPPPAPTPAPAPQAVPSSNLNSTNEGFVPEFKTVQIEGLPNLTKVWVLKRISTGMYVGPAGNPPPHVVKRYRVARILTGNAGVADLYINDTDPGPGH